jgi:tetrahydromethanopterin S-methyltransferase subunit G
MMSQDSGDPPRTHRQQNEPQAEADETGLPPAGLPAGLPTGSTIERIPLESCGFEILAVPLPETEPAARAAAEAATGPTATATAWAAEQRAAPEAASCSLTGSATPPLVAVPLYGCHVIWATGRGAVIGPAERLPQLRATLAAFARCEDRLREAERQAAALLDAARDDAPLAFNLTARSLARQQAFAARFGETIDLRRRLAVLAPTVHAPPVHPPTLGSQLAERLRDRTRLPDRLELVTERVEIAGDVYEACGQRAGDLAIARRQIGLEWAIVVLLVIQTALIVVELLSWGAGS